MALGHLGLHPHHYDEYSFRELILKYRGWDQVRAWDEQILERVAYAANGAMNRCVKGKFMWKVDKDRVSGKPTKKTPIKKIKVTRRGINNQ